VLVFVKLTATPIGAVAPISLGAEACHTLPWSDKQAAQPGPNCEKHNRSDAVAPLLSYWRFVVSDTPGRGVVLNSSLDWMEAQLY
jgi:hypothetical protein